jgi:hypothetical protein
MTSEKYLLIAIITMLGFISIVLARLSLKCGDKLSSTMMWVTACIGLLAEFMVAFQII